VIAVRPVEFVGSSLDDLRAFPRSARHEAGYQLDRVQHGLEPDDWKPMKIIGPGVQEIRVRDGKEAFRVVYVAKLGDAIYVLHCFQKKTQKTSRHDLHTAEVRYRDLLRGLR
jgi:phage-related protein